VITEEQKYRAYTFNIAGFALMTPLARIVADPLATFKEYGLNGFIVFFIFCLFLFFAGIVFISIGRGILDTYRKI